MRLNKATSVTLSPPSIYHTNKEPLPNTYEKGERGCICSEGSMSGNHYEDQRNNPSSPARHAEPSPRPESPEPTSSHSSSEAFSVATSTSCVKPPCDLRDGTFVSMMELSSSQKETKETFEEQDSRGGGLPCPDETSVWRFLKEPGIGDCRKSPKMGHWQQDEGLEL